MYAIRGNSWRSISSPEQAEQDETVVSDIPQNILDATSLTSDYGVRAAIYQEADDALANLRAYRDLASPTNAQTVAAVKLLCRVVIVLARLYLRKLDAAN